MPPSLQAIERLNNYERQMRKAQEAHMALADRRSEFPHFQAYHAARKEALRLFLESIREWEEALNQAAAEDLANKGNSN